MNTDKKSLIRYTIIIVCTILVGLILLAKTDFVVNVIAKEGVKIEQTFGKQTLDLIDRRTLKAYNAVFIDSDIYATIYHIVLPTRYEEAKSFQERLSKGILLWAQDRVKLIFMLLFLLMQRLQFLIMLAPSASFILIASVLSGMYIRKIKQGNFAFASPTAHRYAIGTLTIFLSTAPFTLMLPIAITPYFYPMVFIVVSIMIQAIIANIAKRI